MPNNLKKLLSRKAAPTPTPSGISKKLIRKARPAVLASPPANVLKQPVKEMTSGTPAAVTAPASVSTALPPWEINSLAYQCLVIMTGLTLLRPGDLFEQDVPFYLIAFLGFLVLANVRFLHELSPRTLFERPGSLCVAGLFLAAFLSHFLKARFGPALESVVELAKTMSLYFAIVAGLTSINRFKNFIGWLVFFITVLTVLALLQYFDVINIPSLAQLNQTYFDVETKKVVVVTRMRSVGIFNDPNDLCIILNLGLVLSLFLRNTVRSPLVRTLLLLTSVMFIWGIFLSKSRGGFLALLAGGTIYVFHRYGKLWGGALLIFYIPLFIALSSTRQANIDLNAKDTAQDRIQIWSDGLRTFRASPVFGSGHDTMGRGGTMVAHNSFIHSLTETGFVGAFFFLGYFYFIIFSVRSMKRERNLRLNARLGNFHSYLLFATVALMVALMSLSRNYSSSTLLIPGLASSFFRLVERQSTWREKAFRLTTILPLGALTFLSLILLYVFVRYFSNYV